MKKRALDKSYEEINAKYKNMSEEDIKKEIDNLEKELTGKLGTSSKLKDGEKENLDKNIEKLNIKIENLRGYSKNKTQISKIIDFRNQLETKLKNVTKTRDESKKLYNESKKEFDVTNNLLNNPSKTSEMDQYEYNALIMKKDYLEKEVKKQQELFEKSNAKIEDLKSKIGKCNLAWRTLFTNKTWEDIQLRAVEANQKYSKKIDEKEKTDVKEQENENEEKINVNEQENLNNVNAVKQEDLNQATVQEQPQTENSNLPAKITTWTKVKSFFKSITSKLKATFGKEEVAKNNYKQDNGTKEQDIENNSKQAPSANKEQKDAFLEALRQHVDIDYKEAVKKAKEQQYVEQHNKKENENQK